MKFLIFTYQDQADKCRVPITVCVCLDHLDNTPHAHLAQGYFDKAPTTLDEFLKYADKSLFGQVVLSVSDFPNLTKRIKQAVKMLRGLKP